MGILIHLGTLDAVVGHVFGLQVYKITEKMGQDAVSLTTVPGGNYITSILESSLFSPDSALLQLGTGTK